MENIKSIETYNTGGNFMVEIIELYNGKVLVISEDMVGLYPSKEAFLDYEDENACINGFTY